MLQIFVILFVAVLTSMHVAAFQGHNMQLRSLNHVRIGKVDTGRFDRSMHLQMVDAESTIAKLKAMAAQLRAEAAQLEVTCFK